MPTTSKSALAEIARVTLAGVNCRYATVESGPTTPRASGNSHDNTRTIAIPATAIQSLANRAESLCLKVIAVTPGWWSVACATATVSERLPRDGCELPDGRDGG